jgi:hypothetical protein
MMQPGARCALSHQQGRELMGAGVDVFAAGWQCVHFIFAEPVKRLSRVGVLTNGAVHADIIADIPDRYAPIISCLA